jgi:hypothetical protein
MINQMSMRPRTNALLLFGTFGLSQGAMLLVQSWLILAGHVAFVGRFGVSFSMATLGYYLIDWGGVILIARNGLAGSERVRDSNVYWYLSFARVIIALCGMMGVIFYANITTDEFSAAYALACVPILLFGAFNPAGIIDSEGRSGLNGIASTLPSFTSAISLLMIDELSPAQQGQVLGLVFCGSTFCGITFQFAALKRSGGLPRFVRPNLRSISNAFSDGAMLLLTSAPPLVFYRVELSASLSILGASSTGMFVYVRQIVAAIMQGAQFVRRAEFPKLMTIMDRDHSIYDVIKPQKFSLIFTLLGSIAFLSMPAVYKIILERTFGVPFMFIVFYASAILIAGAYAAIVQIYIGAGRIFAAALVTNIVVGIATIAMFPVTRTLGIYAFPAVEFGLNAISLIMLASFYKRKKYL